MNGQFIEEKNTVNKYEKMLHATSRKIQIKTTMTGNFPLIRIVEIK